MNFLTKSITNKALKPPKCHLLLQTLTSRFASTKSRKPKIPKPIEPSLSYSLTNPKIEIYEVEKGENVEKVSSWPRPSEIPYQAKVANCVNLVGFVQSPVQFETSIDWKYCASTVIAHECSSDDKSVLMIPVVFSGDLAHVVACHVKENDCVYVSGKLSMDPLPVGFMDECQSCFHIVAENVNFVEGLKRRVSVKGSVMSIYPKGKSFVLDGNDKQKDGLSGLGCDGEVNMGGRKEEGVVTGGDEWRDLVKNPNQWWDCRKAKLDGIVKARHPDFKKKDSSVSLWLENAPRWVLEGIEGVGFDVYAPKSKGVGKEVDSWKDLLENPDKWWDNRARKMNQKAPDFKHKNTGIGLWVDSSPEWVLSQLPPLQEQRAASSDE